MSTDFDPVTGEILDAPGTAEAPDEYLAEPPAELDEEPPPPEEDESPAEEEPADGAAFDARLWARDAAEVAGEILGRKVSTGEFRRMVYSGAAPMPLDGSDQWSHAELEKALASKRPAVAAGPDFELFARDAAELAGELLGIRLTAGGFRQLVIDGDAPAPIHGTERWSQKAVKAWADRKLAAAAEEGEDTAVDPEAEAKPVHRDLYDFWERTYSVYYELHDMTPNALAKAKPGMTWCRKWWLHRSVVGRINAAWFAWEVAHAEGGAAISAWILEHADRHFDRIMAENGPLRMCKGEHSDALDVYPTEPAPEALRTPTEEEGAGE